MLLDGCVLGPGRVPGSVVNCEPYMVHMLCQNWMLVLHEVDCGAEGCSICPF